MIKEGERVYADETTLPTLAPGSGKMKTAWLWTYARDDRTFGGTAPPMVAYRFEDILDRLVHNAYRIELTGDSMRKRRLPEKPETAQA